MTQGAPVKEVEAEEKETNVSNVGHGVSNEAKDDHLKLQKELVQQEVLELKKELLALKNERIKEEQRKIISEAGVPKVSTLARNLSICFWCWQDFDNGFRHLEYA